MPMDLDMILSASPPLFASNLFSEYRFNPCAVQNKLFNDRIAKNGYRRASTNVPPVRSCLIPKDEEIQSEPTSPTRMKRRVSFADDRGLSLTQVRIMSEPSDCPPKWTDDFLAQITTGLKIDSTGNSTWDVTFPQPASDYMSFRNRLENNMTSLENVIIKNDEQLVTGTIKVKNISFEKEVVVRASFDCWKTYQDFAASYVPNGMDNSNCMFDTFSFSFPIPAEAVKIGIIEFCVCFRCGSSEYWDNNSDGNYKLVSVKNKEEPASIPRFVDAFKAEVDSWTEFASWNNLVTQGPYW